MSGRPNGSYPREDFVLIEPATGAHGVNLAHLANRAKGTEPIHTACSAHYPVRFGLGDGIRIFCHKQRG